VTIRIAVLNFVHETVTFLPNCTALADFVHDGSPARGEALSGEPSPPEFQRTIQRTSLSKRQGCLRSAEDQQCGD